MGDKICIYEIEAFCLNGKKLISKGRFPCAVWSGKNVTFLVQNLVSIIILTNVFAFLTFLYTIEVLS